MTDMPPVHPALAEALAKQGYETLTEVQTAATAPEHAGKDLLVSAQTGSGKTVAFGLAMAADILGDAPRFGKGGKPRAIIVAPTRELALQVKRELDWLYGPANAKIASCVGGMDQRDERRVLNGGVHIVVGTPGRLSDHIRRNNLDTSEIAAVVLDEADEMLDMGFREELEHILEDTPETRRTLLFSATVPRGIAAMAKRYQNNATRITTSAESSQHVDIDYQAMLSAPGDEEAAILNLLRYSDSPSALVFCGTRAAVNRLLTRLSNRGLSVVALSGELSQKERTNALQALRDGRARVCVATDVAARGLDLKTLDLVIHADMPRNAETLLHRSGRTGRAGRKGTSVLIVQPKMRRRAERLLDDAKIDATWGKPPSAADINARNDERLINDPSLAQAPSEHETTLAAALIEKHGAEHVAAAFIRQMRSAHGAPEELRDVHDKGPRSKEDKIRDRDRASNRSDKSPRDRNAEEFADSTWVRLSVGRHKNAEPRWLIPMLCKYGGLTSKQIGAIRINPNETHVQLQSAAANKFFAALDGTGALEKGVHAEKMDHAPESASRNSGGGGGSSRRRERGDRNDRDARPARKPRPARPDRKPSDKTADFKRKARRSGTSSADTGPKSETYKPAAGKPFDPDRPTKKRKDRHRDRPDGAGGPSAKKKKPVKAAKPGRKPHRKGGGRPMDASAEAPPKRRD